jgi:FkbM family methyltransferase
MLIEAIIDSAYRGILGREPDPEGRRSALEALAGEHIALAEFFSNMLDSPEYRRSQVDGALIFRHTKPVCTLIEDRLRLWIDLADRHVSLGCLTGDYEPSETHFVLSNLNPGDRFLDIGANVGWFAVRAAERVGPTGHVHAFEPRAATAGLLDRSIIENGFETRLSLHRLALGAEDGVARLLGCETSNNLGGFRLARDDGDTFDGMTSEAVAIATLDSLSIGGPVRLIKIDVEGAEPLVLNGGRALLARDRPVILSEVFGAGLRQVSNMDVADYTELIADLGYRIHALENGTVGERVNSPAALDQPDPVNVVLVPDEA